VLLEVTGGASVNLGDLLVVEGTFTGEHFAAQAIVYHVPCPEPRGNGEWSRFRWRGKAAKLAARAKLTSCLRRWFDERDFVEVHTPTLLEAPGLDSGVDALTAEGGYLVTSPELHMKRLLVGGLPRVYQLATCFRRDELGPHHQPEFTMLEWYRGFCDLAQIMDDTEALIVCLAEALGLGGAVTVAGRVIRLARPFLRLSVEDAFRVHAGVLDVHTLAAQQPEHYFDLMVGRVEPALAAYDCPVFLTRYPASQAALARLCPDDPRAAERSELYLAGVELCNAYGELSDATEQRTRFEAELEVRLASGKTTYPLDLAFLNALDEGMPPSAGNALGLDRLFQLLLGQSSIAEAIAFPR
jgi:lysyl-tRNA synthetase class 2